MKNLLVKIVRCVTWRRVMLSTMQECQNRSIFHILRFELVFMHWMLNHVHTSKSKSTAETCSRQSGKLCVGGGGGGGATVAPAIHCL